MLVNFTINVSLFFTNIEIHRRHMVIKTDHDRKLNVNEKNWQKNDWLTTYSYFQKSTDLILLTITVLITVFLYLSIYRTKSVDISWKNQLNKRTHYVADLENQPLRLTNVFENSIQMERKYLKSVNISITLTLLFFVLHHIIKWRLEVIKSLYFPFFKECVMENQSNFFDCAYYMSYQVNCYLDSVICPAIINPIVFCLNNEDFKIKLKRPARDLKWKLLQMFNHRCGKRRKSRKTYRREIPETWLLLK